MSKSFILSKLKPLLAASVVAVGAVVSTSEFSPASALTLTNSGSPVGAGVTLGDGVTGFKQKEWVHLINPSATGNQNPIMGVIILESLNDTLASFRIRIDNNLLNLLSEVRFSLQGGPSLNSASLGVDPNPPGETDRFTTVALNGRRITLGTVNNASALSGGAFDELVVNVTGNFSGFINTGLGLNSLEFGSPGNGNSVSYSPGRFSSIPTPALLPGLVAMGLGVWRKRKQEESAIEAEAVEMEQV